jgi:hypothetical protein
MDTQLLTVLERIASALEKIADRPLSASSTAFTAPPPTNGRHPADESVAAPAASAANDINPILRFLSAHDIEIKAFQADEEKDEVLDSLSQYMGNKYTHISRVYNRLKRSLNNARGFRHDLKHESQEVISYSTQFCSLLHKYALLTDYRYFNSPKFLITGKPARIPMAINFLTGQWLERFVKSTLLKATQGCDEALQFAYLMNPQIILPNGDDFELDVLFYLEGEIYWFEAKTGQYQNYVEKYARMSRLLNLDQEHAYMVLTDIDANTTAALTKLFKMQVLDVESFAGRVEEIFFRFAPQPTEPLEIGETSD